MKARIFITFKKGVLEPQGKAVRHSLHTLGFTDVEEVRVGRLVDLGIEARSTEEARTKVQEMCKKLLVNPVIEDFSFDLLEEKKC